MSSVLVCDDAPAVRTSLINRLHELGIDEIFECCNGTEAMSLAREYLPDIAIIDTAISHNAGLCAVREIRQKQKIPVILLMSSYDPDALGRARKIGITTILSKPLREQDLLPAMEMAFAHAKEVKRLNEELEYLEKTIENQNIVCKAKRVLLQSEGLSESEAFRKIQKQAMDRKKTMRQIAEAILNTGQVRKGAGENKKKFASTGECYETASGNYLYKRHAQTGRCP